MISSLKPNSANSQLEYPQIRNELHSEDENQCTGLMLSDLGNIYMSMQGAIHITPCDEVS